MPLPLLPVACVVRYKPLAPLLSLEAIFVGARLNSKDEELDCVCVSSV